MRVTLRNGVVRGIESEDRDELDWQIKTRSTEVEEEISISKEGKEYGRMKKSEAER